MTSNPAIREPAAAEERDFKRLLEEAARLCRQDVSPETFYGRLLDQAVAALLARGGAVWLLDPDGNLQVCYQTNLAGAGIEESTTAETSHRRLIRVVLREGEARTAAPRSGPAEDAGAGNPTEHLLLLCPVLLPSPQSRPVSGRTPVTHPAAEPLESSRSFSVPKSHLPPSRDRCGS